MRPANPLALMVIGHAALLAAVHLHVGGVPVDHYRPAGQRRRPLRGQHVHHRGGHCRQTRLHLQPLAGRDAAGQLGSSTIVPEPG